MSEVIAGPTPFSLGDESLEAPVIFVAVASDRLDDPRLARLCNVPRRLLEGIVEPGAMLLELRHRAIAVPQQQKERGRIYPLQTLFHILRGDHRVVIG